MEQAQTVTEDMDGHCPIEMDAFKDILDRELQALFDPEEVRMLILSYLAGEISKTKCLEDFEGLIEWMATHIRSRLMH